MRNIVAKNIVQNNILASWKTVILNQVGYSNVFVIKDDIVSKCDKLNMISHL